MPNNQLFGASVLINLPRGSGDEFSNREIGVSPPVQHEKQPNLVGEVQRPVLVERYGTTKSVLIFQRGIGGNNAAPSQLWVMVGANFVTLVEFIFPSLYCCQSEGTWRTERDLIGCREFKINLAIGRSADFRTRIYVDLTIHQVQRFAAPRGLTDRGERIGGGCALQDKFTNPGQCLIAKPDWLLLDNSEALIILAFPQGKGSRFDKLYYLGRTGEGRMTRQWLRVRRSLNLL